jgi:hypothetical protein
MKLPCDPRRADLWLIGGSFAVLFVICAFLALKFGKDDYWGQVGVGLTYSTIILFVTWLVLYVWVPAFYSKEQEETRLREILTLLREELASNIEVYERKPQDWVLPGCRNEFWLAISHSGDIQFIKNLKVLYSIAEAYHFVAFRIEVEKLIKQAYYYPGGKHGEPERGLYGLLDQATEPTLQRLRKVVEEINTIIGPA